MLKSDDVSDEDLMTLYQAGETEAFEVLYKRHSGKIFEFLLKRTSKEIAQDLVQEVFLKVHRFRHQYSRQFPFLAWVFTMARNTMMDFFKKNETKVAAKSSNAIELLPEVKSSDLSLDLRPALHSLTETQRKAIELKYLSDWSFEKIAIELETTPSNIRQMISRGIRKLRISLNRKGGS